MGTSLIDNFDYRGRRFLDSRQSAATLGALRAIPESTVPDGFRAHCAETGLWYEFNSANAPDPSTGRWRALPTELAQQTGARTDIPMSQKAATDAITETIRNKITDSITGDEGTVPSNRAVRKGLDKIDNIALLCGERYHWDTDSDWTLGGGVTRTDDGYFAGVCQPETQNKIHIASGGVNLKAGKYIVIVQFLEVDTEVPINLYVYNKAVNTVYASSDKKMYASVLDLASELPLMPQILFMPQKGISENDYLGKFKLHDFWILEYDEGIFNLIQDGGAKTITNLSSVLDSLHSQNADLATDALSAVSVDQSPRLLKNYIGELTVANLSQGSVYRNETDCHFISVSGGNERPQFAFSSHLEEGKEYIFYFNILELDMAAGVTLRLYDHSSQFMQISKVGFHVARITAQFSDRLLQCLCSNTVLDEHVEAVSLRSNLIGLVEYDDFLFKKLQSFSRRPVEITRRFSNFGALSLEDADLSPYFEEESITVYGDRMKDLFSAEVSEWNSVAADGTMDFSAEGELKVCTGSIPSDSEDKTRTYWGFGIQDKTRPYVMVFKGTVKGTNIGAVYLGNKTRILLTQDVEDNVEIYVEGMMAIGDDEYNVTAGSYNALFCVPKNYDEGIAFEYQAELFFICNYIEGASLDDYMDLYASSRYYPKYLPKDLATKAFVNDEIKKIDVSSRQLAKDLKFSGDVNMLINYGQSLSVGGSLNKNAGNFYKTLVFNGGGNEWASNVDINNTTSVEDFYGDELYILEETSKSVGTPVGCNALAWMKLLAEENDIDLNTFDYQFLLSTPGLSGAPIESFIKGTSCYQRLLFSVTKGKELSNKACKNFNVPAVFWVQGEGNTGVSSSYPEEAMLDYFNKLKQMFIDLNNDIKEITGQKNDVIFITYQMAPVLGIDFETRHYTYSGPSWAHLKAALELPNVYLGGAMYQYDYGTDLWHPLDRCVVGLQAGIVAKRIINDGRPYPVFYPKSYWIQEDSANNQWLLSIKYDVPCEPMRFDISGDKYHNINGKQPNYGFTLRNLAGDDIIKADPVIRRGNELVIICKENPIGAKLSYAVTGHFGGGNLCDSQNLTMTVNNTEYLIDNFAPAFLNFVIE